ncbi:hypothetical protein MNBD_ACTINO02-1988, partial [hydrothermal vent metagenome]
MSQARRIGPVAEGRALFVLGYRPLVGVARARKVVVTQGFLLELAARTVKR